MKDFVNPTAAVFCFTGFISCYFFVDLSDTLPENDTASSTIQLCYLFKFTFCGAAPGCIPDDITFLSPRSVASGFGRIIHNRMY